MHLNLVTAPVVLSYMLLALSRYLESSVSSVSEEAFIYGVTMTYNIQS